MKTLECLYLEDDFDDRRDFSHWIEIAGSVSIVL